MQRSMMILKPMIQVRMILILMNHLPMWNQYQWNQELP
jgi:hypothetical protein